MLIKVYTKPSCVQCNATYRALDNKNINYEKIDVTHSSKDFDYVVSLGYSQVPVVVAGDDHWSGFRPDKIDNLARKLSLVK